MTKRKRFDLIFSIGEACSCTESLRKYDLQRCSYPFDWLFGSNFVGRCKILANKFDNFIEKEDLEYSYEEKSIKCSAYHNKINDITFNHDFLKEIPFDTAYNLVKEKYDRRIKRLLDEIDKSDSILAVYMESPTTNHSIITNEEIIEGYFILKEAFGDKLNLLYIRNDNKNNEIEFLENNKITKITHHYKNYNHEFDHVINIKNLKSVFLNYKLNLPFGYIIQKKITKILIGLIPIRSIRGKLRKKYHV